MPGAADLVLLRGLPAALAAARFARARALAVGRRHPNASLSELTARCRAELQKAEPLLARAVSDAALMGWLAAARRVAREAAPVIQEPGPIIHEPAPIFTSQSPIFTAPIPITPIAPAVRAPLPPPPPPPPLSPDLPEPRPLARWPVIEAAAAELVSRRVVTPAEFANLSEDAKSAAFAVARVTTESAVEAVRDAVADAVTRGKTLRSFRRAVAPALEGSGLADHHVEALFRSQTAFAYSAGLRRVVEHPLVGDEFPYVAWEGILDARIRPQHRAMMSLGIQGTNVFRVDDPVLRDWWAPVGWNCRCTMVLLTIEDAAARGVHEARTWLRAGVPPEKPAWVDPVPFDLPKGWPRNTGRIAPVVG